LHSTKEREGAGAAYLEDALVAAREREEMNVRP